MALQRVIYKMDSSTQAISYSGINGDAHAYDGQYGRFKSFVNDSCTLHKESLEVLLYPLFVHIYLDMLCNGQKTPAHKFYSRHSGQFISSSFSDIVNELELMYNKEDIMENHEIREFREHKYTVALSPEALLYIQRYLKQDENILLLQMFNNYIEIKVQNCEINQDLFQLGDRDLEGFEPVSQPCTPENKVIQDEITLSALQSCITTVRTGPPPLPSVCMYTFLNLYQGLCCTEFSRDENFLVGGFEDSSIRLWNLKPSLQSWISKSDSSNSSFGMNKGDNKSNKEVNANSNVEDNEDGGVNINHIHLSGDYIEDVHKRNKIKSRSTDGSSVYRGHSGSVYSCSFTYDSSHMLSASQDSTVRLWDINNRKCKVCYSGHSSYPVWCVDSSPVCDYFSTGSQDNTARLWCTDRIFPLRSLIGHTSDVNVVQFHPNGTYLATGSSDKTVRLWSVQDCKAVRLFQGHKSGIYTLAFSPDGHMLASAGEDRKVRVWDLTSGTLFKELRGHSDIIYSLCFNKDSTILVSGGMDATLRFWDIRKNVNNTNAQETFSSNELLGAFSSKSACVQSLVYSKSNYILSSGALCS